MTRIFDFFGDIGSVLIRFFEMLGEIVLFALNGVSHFFRPPFYLNILWRQLLEIGYFSLPVVGMTTLFSGMVLALQSYSGFQANFAEATVPVLVVVAITRELAPVLAGLMVAGRIGASMAAELGTMRVTEQIDALGTLQTDPFKYLIAPRLLAGMLMLPFLVLIGDILGIMGGFIVGAYKLNLNPIIFITNSREALDTVGVVSGIVKAAVFGFVVSLMGCYHGFNSSGGARGVGTATTNAVVSASILILIFNYFITELFFSR
ncbi:MAG: ABC transporter permease [Alphaproteobacteria bacterium]|nr:ABC transporter permease [Alphaproteobacteria bacterium]